MDLLLHLENVCWRVFYRFIRVVSGLYTNVWWYCLCCGFLLDACNHIGTTVPLLSDYRRMLN